MLLKMLAYIKQRYPLAHTTNVSIEENILGYESVTFTQDMVTVWIYIDDDGDYCILTLQKNIKI
jgi:hypothetical protein